MLAVAPPGIPSVQVGTRVFTDLGNLIILLATFSGTTTGISTFRKSGASAGYTPSGSKTFVVAAIEWRVLVGQPSFVGFGYGNNDVGVGVNVVPTTPIYECGDLLTSGLAATAVQDPIFGRASQFVIPNGKFPFINAQAGAGVGQVVIAGYEV